MISHHSDFSYLNKVLGILDRIKLEKNTKPNEHDHGSIQSESNTRKMKEKLKRHMWMQMVKSDKNILMPSLSLSSY
jgi:hypothetical protein